jgi:hypothetical protein
MALPLAQALALALAPRAYVRACVHQRDGVSVTHGLLHVFVLRSAAAAPTSPPQLRPLRHRWSAVATRRLVRGPSSRGWRRSVYNATAPSCRAAAAGVAAHPRGTHPLPGAGLDYGAPCVGLRTPRVCTCVCPRIGAHHRPAALHCTAVHCTAASHCACALCRAAAAGGGGGGCPVQR